MAEENAVGMTAILDELCRETRNYFVRDEVSGTFAVVGGVLLPPAGLPLTAGQYYRISGSVFGDGVHRYPDANLTDEVFTGTVASMALPTAFLALAAEIAAYRAAWDRLAAEGKWTGYASESFGGYSYTLPTNAPVELREMAARIETGKRQWRRVL